MELGVKERDRISLLRQAHDGLVTVSEAAARAEVTTRHLRRLLRRFETEGDAVAVHGLRGRRSNRALPREVRERARKRAKHHPPDGIWAGRCRQSPEGGRIVSRRHSRTDPAPSLRSLRTGARPGVR